MSMRTDSRRTAVADWFNAQTEKARIETMTNRASKRSYGALLVSTCYDHLYSVTLRFCTVCSPVNSLM